MVGLGAVASLAGADDAKGHGRPVRCVRLRPARSSRIRSWTPRGSNRCSTGVRARSIAARTLTLIGMPIGGICAGQLYLGGDGKLWHWDIFNRVEHTNDAHYANPMRPQSPLDQGFALRIKSGKTNEVRTLDRAGFSNVRFRGEYPIGFVNYSDPALPVAVAARGVLAVHPSEHGRFEPAGDDPHLPDQERLAQSRSR